jgi:O-antigen biosynthesis protein
MPGKPTNPPSYCITGHGRSGTSFIAAMLQTAGLDIGQRLMGPGEANPRGHFEDMDFHDFHVAVLKSHGFGDEGFIAMRPLHVQQQLVAVAQAIVQQRRQAGRPWGWKEPRSTLFLDFWREQVPELRFLLLFRRPWDVIDSLFRRGDPTFHKNPNLAVQVWLNYNQVIIDFHDRFPERCLLIESHAAARAMPAYRSHHGQVR